MIDRANHIETIFKKYKCDDFKWIDPNNIVVSQWVRMKCKFGCTNYGKNLSCPPNTPSIDECRRFFKEYKYSAIFHFSNAFEKPDDRFLWSKQITKRLLKIEREVFLTGYHKAFVLPFDECNNCKECERVRENCKNPKSLRPIAEAMGVDFFETARKFGYPIHVLKEHSETMNRFAFLMVD